MDNHGQPPMAFRKSANVERAANTLIGICRGLVSDRNLNELELAYLQTWLSNNVALIGQNSDAFDIADMVKDILNDRVVTPDELDDLKAQLESVVRHTGGSRFKDIDAAMHHLTGIVHGLVADAHLSDQEINSLSSWLDENEFLSDIWPASQVYTHVKQVLSDGVVSEEERFHLYQVLTSLNGGALEEIGTVGGVSTRIFTFDMPDQDLIIEGKTFLLTGKFVFGPRARCEQAIMERGGQLSGSVNKKTDYLVVGSLSSRDWINESYGRKIEAAMELRQSGHHILLVEEEKWALSLS